MLQLRWFIPLGVVLLVSVARADQYLDEIQVIADAPDSRDDIDQVNIEQFTGFSKRIEREQFSQDMTTVSDVLDEYSSAQVRQIGGYGGFSTVSLRGSSSKQVNVFLDGMLINSAQSGASQLNLVPASVLNRIDVYPDFTPVQLSNANLGGAINLVTLDVFTPTREISIAQGSYGQQRYALSLADMLGDWHFLLGADVESADNDYEVLNNQATYFNADDDVFEAQNNAAFGQQSLLLKAGRQWSVLHKLELLLNVSDTDKEVPAVDNNKENRATLDTAMRNLQLKYNREYGDVVASHRLYGSQSIQEYDDRLGQVGNGQEQVRTTEEGWGLANIFALDWLNQTTTLNLEYREDSVDQYEMRTGQTPLDNQREQWLLGLQEEQFFWQDKLTLSMALRYYHVQDAVQLDADGGEVFIDGVYSDISDSDVNPSAGLAWFVVPELKLKANVARQSRLPTLQERFGVSGQSIGNPELKTETSTNWDVGFEWQQQALALSGAYFEKDLQDGIVLVYDSRAIAQAQNLSKAEIRGYSIDATWRASSWLTLTAGGTWLDSINLSNAIDQHGKYLPGFYHDSINVGTEFGWRQWLLRLLYRFDGDLYYNPANNVDPVEKELLDVQLRWAMESIAVQLNVDNVTDERYEDFNRFWGPGRAFNVNFTFNW